MIPVPRNDSGMLLVDVPSRAALEVDLGTGPASSFAGLRLALAALAEAGAGFGDVPERHPAEWARLTRPSATDAAGLAAVALSPSERRLHRESEQTFRVLSVAAAALARGSEHLGLPLVLHGAGRTDLPSLRGIVRASEYAAATGMGRISVSAADAVRVLPARTAAADTRAERLRCLAALGLHVDAADLVPVSPDVLITVADPAPDGVLFAAALDPAGSPAARLSAALAYCRSSFYATNWEGMALVAAACLPLAARLTPRDLTALAEDAGHEVEGDNQAIEFETALLRHAGDLHAYLLKVLGIQASFRGLQDEALGYFRAMRDVEGQVSPETRAQSHLYCALTLAKRQHRLPEAVAELEAGFAVVSAQPGEPASVRRERGWLHNLRGLTLFRQGDLVGALEHEKAALSCVDGGNDASSVHLRVNLVSNVSVLQESAGRLNQALQTWERFRREGTEADPKFVKHHSYRAGALQVRGGDVDGGLLRLGESLQRCVEAADDFHEFEIAAELGTLLLGRGRTRDAEDHYEWAAEAAGRVGDPYRIAVAAVGVAAAAGTPVGEHTAAMARRSATQTALAEALLEGCRTGADPVTFLPQLRTKLNRPFDLVTL